VEVIVMKGGASLDQQMMEQGNLEVPNNKRKTWFFKLSKLTNYYYFISEMSI
jgi:hypothetical protein